MARDLISYPDELASFWLAEADRETGRAGRETLLELEGDVRALSEGFTTQRPAMDYATTHRRWVAYGLFYFPQTFTRLALIVDELIERGWSPPSLLRTLDLGAGTGAATCALARRCGVPLQATLVDRSFTALALAGQLLPEARRVPGDLREVPPGPWDVIVASYALNEAFAEGEDGPLRDWLARAAAQLADHGLLIVCEPVVQSAGPRMDHLRTWALEAGLQVRAPCLHQQGCPLAARSAWCHDVRRWKVPESTRYLNRKLFRSVEDLKFSFLVAARGVPGGGAAGARDPQGPEHLRVVAPVRWLKGKWEITGCAADGQLHSYEAMKRDLTAEQRHRLNHLDRGERLLFRELRPAGQHLRGIPDL